MKVKLNPLVKEAANALLVTVIFIMVLTLSIGGYMTYVVQQCRMGGRSQAWNMAMAVSEAGLEEGFEHLQDDAPSALGTDGWTPQGGGVYQVTRPLNGTFQSVYTVTINYANPAQPTITSSAYVLPPPIARNSLPSPFFYATVSSSQASKSNLTTTVGRGIQAILTKPTFFNAAMVAKGNIDMNGNNVTVDSFDSGTPGLNVNGQWDASVSGNSGIVASDGGLTNSVSVGNANIYGQLYVGAGEPDSTGPNGFVGTHAWVAAGGTGIEPGYAHTDANFDFPDTSLPAGYSSYAIPAAGSVATVSGTNTVATTNSDMASYPTGLTNGQVLSAVTTNTTLTTVSTYPGALSGLVSNSVLLTVGSYPGAQPGLVTNCIGTTTSIVNPGPEPCLTSVTEVTNVASASELPSSPSGGITTNYAPETTSSYPASGTYTGNVTTNTTSVTGAASYPSPGGYIGSVTTNTSPATSPTFPSSGGYIGSVTTNTTSTTSKAYPASGTYIGAVTPVNGNKYQYNAITGFSYNQPSGYNYTKPSGTYTYDGFSNYAYHVTYYTYGNQFNYTYQSWTYTYPTYTFSYIIYSSGYTYATNNYDDVLSSGSYTATSLGNTIITGPVTLVMPNGYNISTLTIAPGGQLTIYSGGTSFSMSGNNVINDPGLAQDLIVYCAPTVTSFSLSGNAHMAAVIVAPNANVSLSGGGNSNVGFSGSIMANSITLNGHWNFHYDVALSRVPSPGRYILQSWQEIGVARQASLPSTTQ